MNAASSNEPPAAAPPPPGSTRLRRRLRFLSPLLWGRALWRLLPQGTVRNRTMLTFALLSLVFFAVYARLYQVHVHPNEALLTSPREYKSVLPALRGGIFDRNGQPLAQSRPNWKIAVDPGMIPPEDAAAVYQALSAYNICEPERLFAAIGATNTRYRALGFIDNPVWVDEIQKNPLLRRCVRADASIRRVYPLGHETSHLIGYVNSNEDALEGLELSLDKFLRGTPGLILGEANSRRVEIRSRRKKRVEPINGCDIVLTIDQNLQHAVNEALDGAMEEFKPRSCWAIIQDTQTGEILAMASRPDFDPDHYNMANPTSHWNSAVFKQYEPGSVMKTFAAAAALNENLVHTNTLFDVSPGLYAGRPLEDHVSGEITLTEVLQKSSNRGASRLGMMLGKARQEQYLRRFGFGERTGLPLPKGSETTGDLGIRRNRPWSDLQNIRVSIGHGISVSGIQLVNAYSALGNGGYLLKPTLVKEMRNPDGTVLARRETKILAQVIRPEVAEQVLAMLQTVCAPRGTGRRARVPGYTVAGKTGTAQIAIRGGYSRTDFCGSFVGFIPAENPRLTILVTLEAPPRRYHGGTVAAPVFSRIAEFAVNYLGIPPTGWSDEHILPDPLPLDELD